MGEEAGVVWEAVVEMVELPLSLAELVWELEGAVAVAVSELEPELVGAVESVLEPLEAAPVLVPVGIGGVEVRVTPTEAQRPWAKTSAAWTSEPWQVVRMH